MNKLFLILPVIVMTMFTQVHAQSGGGNPLDALAQDLNLSDAQIQKMRQIFGQFEKKQSQVPTPGQVLLDNKAMLRSVLTSKEFDRQKAEQLVTKVTAIIQMATVNRLQLRHDLYQELTPEQQQQYLDMVQAKVAELMQ
ncbi:MAG: Spy/CpxP family protein refolding chaperone [Proteobacteria bacterium]|jgi:periplasmic protein CpxP/Spy|nr:Spy/CpxP family protein refolding chaperone [Pseudomonadota bacterium]MCG6936188.1 Spy/CpxP family protein refolding chaperone [Pseudomonadota bacterium]